MILWLWCGNGILNVVVVWQWYCGCGVAMILRLWCGIGIVIVVVVCQWLWLWCGSGIVVVVWQ